jgi:hypothetical protein
MERIDPPTIGKISIERLLRRYGSGKRRERMEPIYEAMLSGVEDLASPEAIYDEFSLEVLSDLSPWLYQDTIAVTLGLCTLGPAVQLRINQLIREDMLSVVVMDEITLAWVTAITRQMHRMIRSAAEERGLKAGPAYRPGLGRWPLETQRIVFSHLPTQAIGVTLSEDLVMLPRQSTSLIIPLYDRH